MRPAHHGERIAPNRHIVDTLQLYDVAALHYLYGANTSYRTGSDTYSFSNSSAFYRTLWDAGGIDTIDASNQSHRSVIDLRDGEFSSIGTSGSGAALHNLAIAFGAIIENAIGGSGHDTLIGNSVANTLIGGGGTQVRFDNVRLDATAAAIPEPSAVALFAIGGLALLRRRRPRVPGPTPVDERGHLRGP